MSSRTKKFLIIAAVVLVWLVLLGALVVPRLVDVNRHRPEVAAFLESKAGKPVRLGRLELTLYPHLAIQVDDFAMGDPKGFPSGDFFKTQRIYTLFQAGPLWNRKIVIQFLIVEDPVIHLLSNTAGRWNYESPPSPAIKPATAPSSGGPGFSLGTISSISIKGGEATIANLLPSGAIGPTYFDGQGHSGWPYCVPNLRREARRTARPCHSEHPQYVPEKEVTDNNNASQGRVFPVADI